MSIIKLSNTKLILLVAAPCAVYVIGWIVAWLLYQSHLIGPNYTTTMPYANPRLGISVTLPGYPWSPNTRHKIQSMNLEGDELFQEQNELVFVAARYKHPVRDQDTNLLLFASSNGGLISTLPITPVESSLAGRPAVYIEISNTKGYIPSNYHFIQYFLEIDGYIYIVGVGSNASQYDTWGRNTVRSILDSVKIDP